MTDKATPLHSQYRKPDHEATHRLTVLSRSTQIDPVTYDLKGPGIAGDRFRFHDFMGVFGGLKPGDVIVVETDKNGFFIRVFLDPDGNAKGLLNRTAMHSLVEMVGDHG